VSAAIVAAGAGSALGGALSDWAGRKRALLLADALFTLGALCMGAAWDASLLVLGALLLFWMKK
jgi:SP family myo-inositol transporter-like MFS transporter 13